MLRTEAVPCCPVCGGSGDVVHTGLTDRTFTAPGLWSFRRCHECEGLWLDPRPVADDQHLAYDSYFTHTPPAERSGLAGWIRRLRDAGDDAYVARRFGYPGASSRQGRAMASVFRWWTGRRLDAEFSVMRLAYREGGTVLDVGAGDGSVLADLRRHGWAVHGVEVDELAAKVARSHDITVDVGELADQGYPDASFDAVVTSHVIEHVERPRELLAEMRRVLKPGGQLVAVTPNARSMLHGRYGRDWQGLEPPRHLQIFTRASIAAMVAGAGFDDVRAVTTARGANGVARAAWKFRTEGRWDVASRASLGERVVMEVVQQYEGARVRADPDAGEEIAVTARRPTP